MKTKKSLKTLGEILDELEPASVHTIIYIDNVDTVLSHAYFETIIDHPAINYMNEKAETFRIYSDAVGDYLDAIFIRVYPRRRNRFIDCIKQLLTYPERSHRAAVDAGICDYSGQGRDKYGN